MLNIRDFGAVADGKTVNTKAIQAAVDRAGETGETVLVPGGVFITGTIHLNGASLHLEPGAVLKGSRISTTTLHRILSTMKWGCCVPCLSTVTTTM